MEAIQKWRQYLLGNRFQVVTDLEAFSYIYNFKRLGIIKNEKIARWRIEFLLFDFDILHQPGRLNHVADTLSRNVSTCSGAHVTDAKNLSKLHQLLSHPGVAKLSHFIRARNRPYSTEDVKKFTQGCDLCAR